MGHFTARLLIDQSAVAANFRALRAKVAPACQVAAMVKADAYGLGMEYVVPALEEAGCDFFYVANLEEALVLRALTPRKIGVLGGFAADQEKIIRHLGFVPVLNSAAEIAACPPDIDAIWHVDSGMNRMGIEPQKIPDLLASGRKPVMMMTHFASADERADESDDAYSTEQVRRFDSVAPTSCPQSLCNSAAIFRYPSWHRQQVRPGAALYGLNPLSPEERNPMSAIVRWEARILQIRDVPVGETVGYNRTWRAEKKSRLATLGVGYADGFHRAGSNRSVVYWNGQACPVVGRVSMDLVVVDVTEIQGELPCTGDWMEILGPSQSADALAQSWGTIGYEVLTSLPSVRGERKIILL